MNRRFKAKRVATAPTINDELRRLQRTMALLVCIQAAAEEGTEADIGDALAVIVGLLAESLRGLDRLDAGGAS